MIDEPTAGRWQALEDRVSALEQDVDGERIVSRHILQETRANTDLLAVIDKRQERIEDKFDGLDRKVETLERKVDGIDQGLKSLARSLPQIVADAIREVDRERRRRDPPA
jgi:chromosome segregation ATPase